MAQSQLEVRLREGTGKGVARSLRRQGLVPGVVYGKNMEPCPIVVEPKALEAAIATESGWNTLITLRGEGPFAGQVVILKDMTVHTILRTPRHVDFHAVSMKKKVHVMVPVHALGKSAGEKIGGSLEVIRHELEVHCLPDRIPTAIEIDVTNLGIGDVVHIEDIRLPEGVEVPHEVNFTVITCTGRKAEEEEQVEEGTEAENA
ncbi:50S ribosomal protein L25/general stress protein Ctc [Geoalkalibacter halelectricus]|uniref:Large ribosomal subunit protein bL25 n=1 Tax=Geoalkalibacter halelectricus TaxID=2847045 RepID=A0ABY5ZM05_9BACT|nr:50S ribosomal protein L25/general stress protein Ctc [Geoalkalibacter halelectricus]MDO3377047.1 50S ribosomal protein L25/general stress protein Ctc [Geoalkalibacter halelectricus]UWZ79499.1 50S ribosomal protein L25/general stress protein Ctc [Geoalkalibacter halelectricus]